MTKNSEMLPDIKCGNPSAGLPNYISEGMGLEVTYPAPEIFYPESGITSKGLLLLKLCDLNLKSSAHVDISAWELLLPDTITPEWADSIIEDHTARLISVKKDIDDAKARQIAEEKYERSLGYKLRQFYNDDWFLLTVVLISLPVLEIVLLLLVDHFSRQA